MPARAVRPDRDEAAEYYFKYIDLVEGDDICEVLSRQRDEALALFRNIPEARAGYRYAPDKWSVSGVLAHVNDCERLFAFRAFWFARGFDLPLPSFDQMVAAAHDGADTRPLSSHVAEFDALRAATLQLFEHLPADAWNRRGTASGNPFSVRALAFIAAGHVIHHNNGLREHYL